MKEPRELYLQTHEFIQFSSAGEDPVHIRASCMSEWQSDRHIYTHRHTPHARTHTHTHTSTHTHTYTHTHTHTRTHSTSSQQYFMSNSGRGSAVWKSKKKAFCLLWFIYVSAVGGSYRVKECEGVRRSERGCTSVRELYVCSLSVCL